MRTRDNASWVKDLRAGGDLRDAALADLRALLVRALPAALNQWLAPDEPTLEALIEDATQETLLRVLEKLDTFEGRSQFITWVYKVSVRIALNELRRQRWKDKSLDEMVAGKGPDRSDRDPGWMASREPSPESQAARSDALRTIERLLAEELTEKQRQAITALVINNQPIEEVAERLQTNRNALYKILHDARARLKKRMEAEGLSTVELLAMFERH